VPVLRPRNEQQQNQHDCEIDSGTSQRDQELLPGLARNRIELGHAADWKEEDARHTDPVAPGHQRMPSSCSTMQVNSKTISTISTAMPIQWSVGFSCQPAQTDRRPGGET